MAPSKSDEPATWHLLKVVSLIRKADVPPLYYKCQIESSGSNRLLLHLTDLVTLYSCHLSKADIVEEATRSHSPIDPSSSAKQFDVLLNYLSQSLQGSDNAVARAVSDDDDTPDGDDAVVSLKLRTTTELPPPLPALSFTFTLRSQQAADFSATLLYPMIYALEGTKAHNENLLEIIREKDHVIERLLERVGNQVQGDMSLVFPVLTGKRDRSVTGAEKWVKGLQAFEKTPWQDRLGDDGGVEEFEGMLEQKKGKSRSGLTGTASEDWIGRLPDESVLDAGDDTGKSQGKRGLGRQSTRTSQVGEGMLENPDGGEASTESDDDFERQATPPSGKKNANHNRAQTDHSSDASENEPPAKKRKTAPQPSGKKGGKLGRLGKRSKQTEWHQESLSSSSEAEKPPETHATPPETRKTRRTSNVSTASETASEDDAATKPKSHRPTGDDDTAAASPPPSRQNLTADKPKRLGGLKKKSATSSRQSSAGPEQSENQACASPPPSSKGTPSRRLGRLNARKQPDRATTRTPSVGHEPEAGATPSPHRTTKEKDGKNETATPHRLGKLGLRRKNADGKRDDENSSNSASPAGEPSRTRSENVDEDETEDEDEDLDLNPSPSTRQTDARKDHDMRASHDGGTSGEQAAPGKVQPQQQQEKKPSEEEKEKEKEEETPEQAAERRRNELKKTAAAAPARKKRRF